jgi:isocitrate dehydrogenase kinase/phosphatase
MLLEHAHDHELWEQVRQHFARRVGLIDRELYKTFYNTLSRRFFQTRGVDAAIEFIAMDVEPPTPSPTRWRGTYAVSPSTDGHLRARAARLPLRRALCAPPAALRP